MANGKSILRLSVIMLALAGVLGFHMEAMGMLKKATKITARPDVIMIDTIAKLEELEQPAAVFMHDAHTKALKDQGMSCDSCHQKDAKGNMLLVFNRQEGEVTANQLKDIYHYGCITCHAESGAKGFKTGPMVGECRSCHQEKPKVAAGRASASMDNALHTTHWTSKAIRKDAGKDTNCGACHPKAGEEDAWRFDKEFASMPVNDAYHSKCVSCHQELAMKKAPETGPVECAGCHGVAEKATMQGKLAKMEMPRLPYKQPDAVLMTAKTDKKGKVVGMPAVAFNHKLHEGKVADCRTCHVKGVNAEMDKSYEAMHDLKVDSSCMGCHLKEQQKPECAGCHAARPVTKPVSDATCMTCHNGGMKADGTVDLMVSATEEQKEAKAASLIAARPQTHLEVAIADIPEIVEIDVIADKYKPSMMPHRKIVQKMVEGMKDSPLAATFHATPEAMCAGCHHNAPATLKPAKCASCHAKPFTTADGRPGLKAAYHQQCMNCHTEMKLAKPANTNCVACHEKAN